MELRLAARTFGSGDFAIMTDGVMEGADIALVPADPPLIERLCADRARPAIAVAAVYAWLGARVLRTDDVRGTRQVLNMIALANRVRPSSENVTPVSFPSLNALRPIANGLPWLFEVRDQRSVTVRLAGVGTRCGLEDRPKTPAPM
jgi:hypothetical protein